jgi:hypothetical protein
MFEWLEKEIEEIRTPRFHVVDGPANARLREAVETTPFRLPQSYRAFVLRFGNAKLYRNSRRNSYQVSVFAGPRRGISKLAGDNFQIGFADDAYAYVRAPADISVAGDAQVFEATTAELCRVGEDFEEWLWRRCDAARRGFGADGWRKIMVGPDPFTADEQSIVNARREFRWELIGIDAKGDHLIKVQNDSDRVLPFLSLGVRSKDGRLNGGQYLRVQNLQPGHGEILAVDCYKDLVAPEQVELFSLPDPGPEDRGHYWEFRAP